MEHGNLVVKLKTKLYNVTWNNSLKLYGKIIRRCEHTHKQWLECIIYVCSYALLCDLAFFVAAKPKTWNACAHNNNNSREKGLHHNRMSSTHCFAR